MKASFLAFPLLSGFGLMTSFAAIAQDAPTSSPAIYVAKVDPGAFHEKRYGYKKRGVTVNPAAVRMITPGVDKFSIYNLIGPPHFGETITRRWNYVLFFPVAPGSVEKIRCRMEIRFGPKRVDGYNVTVFEVIWQDQSCADRVAAAS